MITASSQIDRSRAGNMIRFRERTGPKSVSLHLVHSDVDSDESLLTSGISLEGQEGDWIER